MKKLLLILACLVLYTCAGPTDRIYSGNIIVMYNSPILQTSWFLEVEDFKGRIHKLRVGAGTKISLISKLQSAAVRAKPVKITFMVRDRWDLSNIVIDVEYL